MGLTDSQRAAVQAQGNVLVEAGAGAGKTSTLIERVLHFLSQPGASVEQVMMVTFTNAAAAEMRERLRNKLMEAQRAEPHVRRHAENLALMDAASIGTLHSFCLRLIRENFYTLKLDPQIRALDEKEAALLSYEVFARVISKHYEGAEAESVGIKHLLESQANSSERTLRQLALRMHRHAQSLDDPAAWFASQRRMLADPHPTAWREWLANELPRWREEWLQTLSEYTGIPQVEVARSAFDCLAGNFGLPSLPGCIAQLKSLKDVWKGGGKNKNLEVRNQIPDLFTDAEFLEGFCPTAEDPDPLQTDWDIARPQLVALLNLAQEFGHQYEQAKREMGALDFSDLEQCALRLLWDRETNTPSPLAAAWRAQIALILVDEYQDINRAQDKIIQAISRHGSNRFLVGDVKQSIYRFRLANPAIFRGYREAWSMENSGGSVKPLRENFRSHEHILRVVNEVFRALMRRQLGGIDYDDGAALVFGARANRHHLLEPTGETLPVELLLHVPLKPKERAELGLEPAAQEDDRSETEREAAMIARRLLELKNDPGFRIHDSSLPEGAQWRPMEWGDAAVMLRAMSGKAADYVKQFELAGVPLDASGAGFYDAQEVRDLRSLLQILDNPLQDIPLLAALRSPFGCFTADELALIRCADREAPWWRALEGFRARAVSFQRSLMEPELAAKIPALQAKVAEFLDRHARWRRMAGQASIYDSLERILEESRYEQWLRTQPRARQRLANVRLLLELARDFERAPQAGIFRFLRMIEAQREADLEEEAAAAPPKGDAVRLMTIHKSKGLEFPLVVLADTDHGFRFQDLSASVLFDETHGLCPRIAPGDGRPGYPSIALWLARRAEKPELLGEELRLLYVAMTRAEQKLILSGCATPKKLADWRKAADRITHHRGVAAGRSFLSWLAPLMPRLAGTEDWDAQPAGRSAFLEWRLVYDAPIPGQAPGPSAETREELTIPQALLDRLRWKYPFNSSVGQPAKASVSRLRHQLAEPALDLSQRPAGRGGAGRSLAEAAVAGSAHHRFLQHAKPANLLEDTGAGREAARLVSDGLLLPEEADQLDLRSLGAFWRSELGGEILAREDQLRRELPFTARFDVAELESVYGLDFSGAAGEFIVVQGVVDLAIVSEEEIWILDFKTDQFPADQLASRVESHALQLRLYAAALERIYRRPVTKAWLHFFSLNRTEAVATTTAAV